MNFKNNWFLAVIILIGSGLILIYTLTDGMEREGELHETSKSNEDKMESKQATILTVEESTKPIDVVQVEGKDNLQGDTRGQSTSLIQGEVFHSGISKVSDEARLILEEAGVLPEDLSEEAYVEFDLETLRSLEVGDTFNLEIPQTSEMFSTEVTNIDKFNNGDKSVFGRLIGSDGVFHTSVLTVGVDAVYGQFTTVSGNYVFESKGKHGWIAAKRDLYKKHVEFEAITPAAPTEASSNLIAPPKD